jgi:hypothetical protein
MTDFFSDLNIFDWKKTSQLSIIQILLAVFIPSGIAFIGFHAVLPAMVSNGLLVLIAWPSIASIMLFVLVMIAVFLSNPPAEYPAACCGDESGLFPLPGEGKLKMGWGAGNL